MLFISNDGKENAWEVLACKCAVRWCCALNASFLEFGRCLLEKTYLHLSAVSNRTRSSVTCIRMPESQDWKFIWEDLSCSISEPIPALAGWMMDQSLLPAYLMYTLSFILDFVSLHTRNYRWRIKATQHIDQKYSFESFFVSLTFLLSAWCFFS